MTRWIALGAFCAFAMLLEVALFIDGGNAGYCTTAVIHAGLLWLCVSELTAQDRTPSAGETRA